MDNSDDQDLKIEQQLDPFRSIYPTKRQKNNPYGHGNIQMFPEAIQIKEQCQKLMNQILDDRIQEMTKKIYATIIQNFNCKNSIVIALNLKRNQRNDLPKIIKNLKIYQRDVGQQKQKIKTVDIEHIAKEDVRDIALQIQIKEDSFRQTASIKDNQRLRDKQGRQINAEKHLVIYVNRRITNLSQQNIHVFQNTVVKGKYAVVLPTFQSLKIVDGQGIIEESQKYFFEAYNSKQLFIEFFYRSIVSKHIMAYLPKQILGLIKMYDYYPISFQQGCNMLIYACQIFNAKCVQKGKPQKKVVQMKQLIRIFNRTWKFIWNDQAEVNRYNFQILSHCILNKDAVYKVSQKKIRNFVRLNTAKDTGIEDLGQKNVYQTFQKKFKQKLNADQNLKHLVKVFDEYDSILIKRQKIKMKNKNGANRELMLGLLNKPFKDQKQIFEDKITRLFKAATQQVRKQAQYVEWSQIKLFESKCPQILKDTVEGIMQDQEFRDVFDMIRSYASLPMSRLIDQFKRLQIGRLIYILRCLQLKGLIELNKNTLKPSLITNFYEKTQYRMAEQQ